LPKGLRPWAHVHADGAIIYNDIGNVSSSGTIQDNGLIKISGQAENGSLLQLPILHNLVE